MENNKKDNIVKNHILHMENRKVLSITGITDVVTFNEELIILNSVMGGLHVKGKDMKINKLNVDTGDMCIEGNFDSFLYTKKDNKNKESIIKRLFK